MRNWINLCESAFGSTTSLFHGTGLDQFWMIYRAGHLEDGVYGENDGISLSRSFEVAMKFQEHRVEEMGYSFFEYFDLGGPPADFSGVIFEFDRSQIANKLVAYDDFGVGVGGEGEEQEERYYGKLSLKHCIAMYLDPKSVNDFVSLASSAYKRHLDGNGLQNDYNPEFEQILRNALNDPRIRSLRNA